MDKIDLCDIEHFATEVASDYCFKAGLGLYETKYHIARSAAHIKQSLPLSRPGKSNRFPPPATIRPEAQQMVDKIITESDRIEERFYTIWLQIVRFRFFHDPRSVTGVK